MVVLQDMSTTLFGLHPTSQDSNQIVRFHSLEMSLRKPMLQRNDEEDTRYDTHSFSIMLTEPRACLLNLDHAY
jgi:hypothetical protein